MTLAKLYLSYEILIKAENQLMAEIIQVLEIADGDGNPTGKFRRTVRSDESNYPPYGLCQHHHDTVKEAAECPDAKHGMERTKTDLRYPDWLAELDRLEGTHDSGDRIHRITSTQHKFEALLREYSSKLIALAKIGYTQTGSDGNIPHRDADPSGTELTNLERIKVHPGN